jgi:hypothetical protein
MYPAVLYCVDGVSRSLGTRIGAVVRAYRPFSRSSISDAFFAIPIGDTDQITDTQGLPANPEEDVGSRTMSSQDATVGGDSTSTLGATGFRGSVMLSAARAM